jgi:putative tricarboxylic transport membrane protein
MCRGVFVWVQKGKEQRTMRAIRWVALIIVLFGLAYLWGALQIREATTYSAVGPRFFPNALGIGMVLSGIWLFFMPGAPPAADSPETVALDWVSVALMAGAVVVYVFLFKPLGYIIATAMMSVAGAQILGGRHHLLRDALIGAGLAVTVAFVFGRLLNISLPPGILGF